MKSAVVIDQSVFCPHCSSLHGSLVARYLRVQAAPVLLGHGTTYRCSACDLWVTFRNPAQLEAEIARLEDRQQQQWERTKVLTSAER